MIRQHPQPFIRVITSNPAKRYYTKHKPVQHAIPPRHPEANYVTAFIQFNHLRT